MQTKPLKEESELVFEKALGAIQELRSFKGNPQEFWPVVVEIFALSVSADLGIVFVADREEPYAWPTQESGTAVKKLLGQFQQLMQKARAHGSSRARLGDDSASQVLAIRLETLDKDKPAVLILIKDKAAEKWSYDSVAFLRIFSDTPRIYLELRKVEGGKLQYTGSSESLAEVLEIQAILNSHERFLAVAMSLVNEVCIRFNASRVSLGWSKGDYIKIKAVSHMDAFESKLDMVRALESAMEECFDQDEEILWPKSEFVESHVVSRQHQMLAKQKGLSSILSLPVRVAEEKLAVMTLERTDEEPFSKNEVLTLELICTQISRRLAELEKHDKWIGKRLLNEGKQGLGKYIGPEHTLTKLIALLCALVLAFLFFWPWPYKVSGTFKLKTIDTVFIPAPFDGFLGEVSFREGDPIKEGEVMLKLDQRELEMDLADIVADNERFKNEAKLALSQNNLSEMRSTLAQAAQTEARLKMVEMKISQSQIKAPFDGFIVESDLRERIGKPIRKGEVLFRVAKLKGMYAEVYIEEGDIEEIELQAEGALAFASRPADKFSFLVDRINPIAEVREESNVFVVKVQLDQAPEMWWRPGMTGVAKVKSDYRSPIWILTHRAVDHLRLKYLWF